MVERRLAKANVASSNLVFRSNSKCGEKPHSWRHSQEVRQRPAKPSPPVQIWVAPPRRRKLRDHNPTLQGGIFSRFDSSSFRKKSRLRFYEKNIRSSLARFFRFACLPTFYGRNPAACLLPAGVYILQASLKISQFTWMDCGIFVAQSGSLHATIRCPKNHFLLEFIPLLQLYNLPAIVLFY